jgi:hypothetical protein
MAKRASDARVSREIRALLPLAAAPEFQGPNVGLGGPQLTYAQVIALQTIQAAAAGKEWAIQMVRDTTEGKPGAMVKDEGGDRQIDERLDDNLSKHLNGLLGAGGDAGADAPDQRDDPEPGEEAGEPDRTPADAPDRTAGAAWSDLDLPSDRDHDSEEL